MSILDPLPSTGGGLTVDDWATLVRHIDAGDCVPFLGAGIASPPLPTGQELAKRWADQHNFPLREDRDDLPRIAQFLALRYRERSRPKMLIVEEFKGKEPDFDDKGEPHLLLAKLKTLSLFVTTNYDNFMTKSGEDQALQRSRPDWAVG